MIFPIAASAESSWIAADREANVSGREVPRATNVMPDTALFKLHTQPNRDAICSTTAVRIPMNTSDITNAGYPEPQNL